MKYLFGLILLIMGLSAKANIKPADGLWGTVDNPAVGSGLMLSTQGNITVVSVFSYNSEGKNVWYLASGQVDEYGVFEAELLETHNGSHILNTNPVSAEFLDSPRTIKLEFTGSQIGSLTIDGANTKTIQALNFGFETNHLIPDLRGQWVMGGMNNNDSYVMDLEWVDVIQTPGTPISLVDYKSVHPSTLGWNLSCHGESTDIINTVCYVTRGHNNELPKLKIAAIDLGAKKMSLYQNETLPHEKYQAFRLNNDRRLRPNDGYWRPEDDPGVGSGLVMRTQGIYTVVLIYTYGEQGQAIWQIGSGQFDETGKLEATIMKPYGGGAIGNADPESAAFDEQPDALEIQMLGTELATFSINGSSPKHIQNLNFGVDLFETAQVNVNGEGYDFPDQEGRWVAVDPQLELHDVVEMTFYNPNCCISPTVPWYQGARGYRETLNVDNNPGDFGLNFICTVSTAGFGVEDTLIPYCTGDFGLSQTYFGGGTKIFFEDIGFNSFILYWGDYTEEGYSHIGRDSSQLTFYRLD